MRRCHTAAEEALLIRRRRVMEALSPGYYDAGRYLSRKKHPMDCGNTRCGACHRDKRFGHTPTSAEVQARIATREVIEELGLRPGNESVKPPGRTGDRL
jgi:hypothetical protein